MPYLYLGESHAKILLYVEQQSAVNLIWLIGQILGINYVSTPWGLARAWHKTILSINGYIYIHTPPRCRFNRMLTTTNNPAHVLYDIRVYTPFILIDSQMRIRRKQATNGALRCRVEYILSSSTMYVPTTYTLPTRSLLCWQHLHLM